MHLLAMASRLTFSLLLCLPFALSQVLFQPQNVVKGYDQVVSVPIDVSTHFNNRAFGMKPKDANFDGYHSKPPESA